MKPVQIIAIVVLIGSLLALFLLSRPAEVTDELNRLRFSNGIEIAIEVADDVSKQTKGLSGREELAQGTGMLFVYSKPAVRSMWMPDMNFPIDVIWLNQGKIIGIDAEVPVLEDGAVARRTSPGKIDAFLEVNSGFCEQNMIQVGDQVDIISLK